MIRSLMKILSALKKPTASEKKEEPKPEEPKKAAEPDTKHSNVEANDLNALIRAISSGKKDESAPLYGSPISGEPKDQISPQTVTTIDSKQESSQEISAQDVRESLGKIVEEIGEQPPAVKVDFESSIQKVPM